MEKVMNSKTKVQFVKAKISEMWKCDVSVFDSDVNVFIESDNE